MKLCIALAIGVSAVLATGAEASQHCSQRTPFRLNGVPGVSNIQVTRISCRAAGIANVDQEGPAPWVGIIAGLDQWGSPRHIAVTNPLDSTGPLEHWACRSIVAYYYGIPEHRRVSCFRLNEVVSATLAA